MAISFFGNKGKSNQQVEDIPISEIVPNQHQPRTNFDLARIDQLAQTIDEHGLLQPISVRKTTEEKYEIIAGERRFRAVSLLGWENIKAIVVDLTDKESASLALIENLQREGLSVVEEARSYQDLLEVVGFTQSELAQQIGKSQSFVANKLRLLKLEPEILEALDNNEITERHARALLKIPAEQQAEFLETVLSDDLNVSQTDKLVAEKTPKKKAKPAKANIKYKSHDIRVAINSIKKSLALIEESGFEIDFKVDSQDDKAEISIEIEAERN